MKSKEEMTENSNNALMESNKLIAEFMGYQWYYRLGFSLPEDIETIDGETYSAKWYLPQDLKYHENWDALMPVVEKIENIALVGCQAYIDISPFCVSVYCSGHHNKELNRLYHKFDGAYLNDERKKKAAFDCVIKFITWYNQQK